MRSARIFFFALSALTPTVLGAASDTHDVVGVGWWGTGTVNGRYWFPADLQWCLNAAKQPYLVSFPCTPSSANVDQLGYGADQIIANGSRVIYFTLNANPGAFYLYTNPLLQPSVFVNPPEVRMQTAVAGRPYADLFKKSFTTYIAQVFSNVPVCTTSNNAACECGSAGCTEHPDRFHSFLPVIDGMSDSERAAETAAMKNLSVALLNNPDLAGKTVVLANLEGDWDLKTDHYGDATYEPCGTSTDPPAIVNCGGLIEPNRSLRVAGMQAWLAARQAGVDAARQENPAKWSCPPTAGKVCLVNAAEVNHVKIAMTTSRMTMTNDVLPALQLPTGTPGWCCDLYSYSFFDVDSNADYTPRTIIDRLNYIKSKVNDSSVFGHNNIILTEYTGGLMLDADGYLVGRQLNQAAVAWGCPYTTYWQLYDGLSANIDPPGSVDYTIRATNDQTDATGLIRPDASLTPLYTYFQSVNILRVGLRTYGGYYVSADNAGGGLIHVNAPWVRAWEELAIVDRNGGTLMSGDHVNILTKNAYFFMAQNGGGSGIDATSQHALGWEDLIILKQNGTGAIGPGDTVAFQTSDGHYLVAEGGGGGNNVLNANRTAIGPWEQFTLGTIPVTCSYAVSPTQQTVAAAGGSPTANITVSAGCGWTVTSNVQWITITSNISWSGNSTVTYTVSANTGAARAGTITVSDDHGAVATVTVSQAAAAAVNPPSNVAATTLSASAVQVTWTASTSSGVTGYYVYCSTDGGPFLQVTPNAVQSPWIHSSLQANIAYRYKVLAWDGSNRSGDSNLDLATSVVFDDPVIYRYQTPVRAIHVLQLRQAIDAVRHAAGYGAASYTTTSLCQSLTAQNQCIGGSVIHWYDIQELRDRLVSVLPLLGLPTPSFTDSSLCQSVGAQNQCIGGVTIKTEHIVELRTALQ